MSNKIYVGNLPFSSTEDELRGVFASYGDVESVNVIMDRDTGRPRGFAFVTMDSKSSMVDAIKALNSQELDGREIKVNEARAREERGQGGGYRR